MWFATVSPSDELFTRRRHAGIQLATRRPTGCRRGHGLQFRSVDLATSQYPQASGRHDRWLGRLGHSGRGARVCQHCHAVRQGVGRAWRGGHDVHAVREVVRIEMLDEKGTSIFCAIEGGALWIGLVSKLLLRCSMSDAGNGPRTLRVLPQFEILVEIGGWRKHDVCQSNKHDA